VKDCFQAGLDKNPNLEGIVNVRFVIDTKGNVAIAQDAGSTLQEPSVIKCIVDLMHGLSFPQPEQGEVTVNYPFVLNQAN
jgi:hypothetical protein